MIAERTETEYQTTRPSSRYTSVYENSAGTAYSPSPRPAFRPPSAPQRETLPVDRGVVRRERSSRSMGYRGPWALRLYRSMDDRGRMAVLVLVASFLVTIISVYVSAYARVVMEGAQEAKLIRGINAAAEEHALLAARFSQLSTGSDADAIAQQKKMVRNDTASEQLLQADNTVLPVSPTTPAVAMVH